jgi:hypothetical protein
MMFNKRLRLRLLFDVLEIEMPTSSRRTRADFLLQLASHTSLGLSRERMIHLTMQWPQDRNHCVAVVVFMSFDRWKPEDFNSFSANVASNNTAVAPHDQTASRSATKPALLPWTNRHGIAGPDAKITKYSNPSIDLLDRAVAIPRDRQRQIMNRATEVKRPAHCNEIVGIRRLFAA